MRKDKKRTVIILLCLSSLLVCGCASRGAKAAGGYSDRANAAADKSQRFPVFDLPIPQSESEKSYLGLSGTGTFRVGQIKAQVLIIEVFNFYCPHCQNAAPRVNDLYEEIQRRPYVKDKIKMIGIGRGNSPYEVNSFREKYQVPFPLFPDQSISISKILGIEGTPTFIGVTLNGKGSQEQFYFKSGGFKEATQFLAEIIKLSGLEEDETR